MYVQCIEILQQTKTEEISVAVRQYISLYYTVQDIVIIFYFCENRVY